MMLYHAFVRPNYTSGDVQKASHDPENDRRSLVVLQNIITHGLLCTPENYKFYPHPNTRSFTRQRALAEGREYDKQPCSRACFTLTTREDLSRVYQISPGKEGRRAHVDQFGRFAIGLDPIAARQFGVLPVVYYYRADPKNHRASPAGTSDLGNLIQYRLDEIRSILTVLCHIEAAIGKKVPPIELLASVGFNLDHEHVARDAIKRAYLDPFPNTFRKAFELFDTDRVPAWQINDFIKMLLSLFQTADSTLGDAPLAFFNQREWRLVHHMRPGMRWFCLGPQPTFTDPHAEDHEYEANFLRNSIVGIRCRPFENAAHRDWFFRHTWVLHSVANLPFRSWIREIVVPFEFVDQVKRFVSTIDWRGTGPEVHSMLPKWSLDANGSTLSVKVESE